MLIAWQVAALLAKQNENDPLPLREEVVHQVRILCWEFYKKNYSTPPLLHNMNIAEDLGESPQTASVRSEGTP